MVVASGWINNEIGFQIEKEFEAHHSENCRCSHSDSKPQLLHLPAVADRSVKVSSMGDCSMDSGSSWLCSESTAAT